MYDRKMHISHAKPYSPKTTTATNHVFYEICCCIRACHLCSDFLSFLFFDSYREMHIFMAKPFCGIRACPLCSDFEFFRFPMGNSHFYGQAFQPLHNRHSEPRILLKFMILVPFLTEIKKI